LRSIASLQRTVSTPPLVDFARASPLDLFEQPARGFFSNLPGESSRCRRGTPDFLFGAINLASDNQTWRKITLIEGAKNFY
jgi:hypothetical protein